MNRKVKVMEVKITVKLIRETGDILEDVFFNGHGSSEESLIRQIVSEVIQVGWQVEGPEE